MLFQFAEGRPLISKRVEGQESGVLADDRLTVKDHAPAAGATDGPVSIACYTWESKPSVTWISSSSCAFLTAKSLPCPKAAGGRSYFA